MIQYQFDFHRYNEHLVDVSLQFSAETDNPVVWLPAWIAGSYLIREFSRHITAVTATIDEQTQRLKKVDKNHWQIVAKKGDNISVNYEVYAYDLSVRGAYVDNTRLYGNFTSLALAVVGMEQQPIKVELICPLAFIDDNGGDVQLATALPDKMHQQSQQTIYQLTAENYEQLTDSPFEIASQDEFWFDVVNQQGQTIPHRFVISGLHSADLERLETDVQKICQKYVDWLGDTPFADYLFMTMATGKDYGGLEHLSSTSLITPRDDLPKFGEADEPNKDYQRFLGLCSHEYFHAWWVKTVRPDVMMDADFSQEAYTPLLWVFEGFTSYFDDLMLLESGVISKQSYLNLLTDQINRYNQTHGRDHQTVAESSFDAWIKLYRTDENTANAGISYYNKGALVACCLDLTLIEHGKRLFDVVTAFYQLAKNEQNQRIGMSDDNLDKVMMTLLPPDVWQDFRQKYVEGLEPLPLETLLQKNGIQIDKSSENALWGLRTTSDNVGLKVQRVFRNSPASEAGISANDVIVAIDGLKVSDNVMKKSYEKQQHDNEAVLCHLFRRDELMLVEIPPTADNHVKSPEKWKLTMADEKQEQQWLN